MNEGCGPDETLEAPDLSLPPHVLPQLFEMFAGGSLPNAAAQQEIEAHLLTCSWCRVTLLYLLSVSEEADRRTGADPASAHALLERWADLHRRLEAMVEDVHTGGDAAAESREEEGREER